MKAFNEPCRRCKYGYIRVGSEDDAKECMRCKPMDNSYPGFRPDTEDDDECEDE